MKFDHLKLTGFKSFVDPTELDISSGLTGVVGPNGCGKSNLVEALRWVMGETSAKQMRGGEMDDVIFNGANSRPARNVAEVILSVDNSDWKAPAGLNDSEQLSVARRIERTKGSNYRVNGRDVRSRDVQLLFADAGTGARSAGIVNQGRVGSLINAKPADRRILLEEAANIRGLHTRRHEAELRLKAAETNLERLEDILGSIKDQLRGLLKQAKQAKRYRTINDQIRKSESVLFHKKWLDGVEKKTQALGTMAEAEKKVQEATHVSASFSRQRVEAAEKLPILRQGEVETAAALQRLNIELQELHNELERLEGAKNATTQRLDQIAQDIKREQTLASEAKLTVDTLSKEQLELSESIENVAVREKVITEEVNVLNVQTQSLESQFSMVMEKLAANQANIVSLEGQISRTTERKNRIKTEINEIEEKLFEFEKRDAADEAINDLRINVEDAEEKAKEATRKLEGLGQARADQAVKVEEKHVERRELNSRLIALETEADSLKVLLADIEHDEQIPVLDQIHVEKGYEKALASALGDDLTAPLQREKTTVFKRYWSRLVGEKLGPELPQGAISLANHVKAPSELNAILMQVGVVESEEIAEKMRGSLAHGQMLTTMNGGLWRWDGFVVRGEINNQSSVRLTQAARLREVSAEVSGLKRKKQEIDVSCEDNDKKLQELDIESHTARTNYKEAFENLDRARKAFIDSQQLELEFSNKKERLIEIKGQLVADLKETEKLIAESLEDLSNRETNDVLEAESDSLRQQLFDSREKLVEARGRLQNIVTQTTDRQTRLSAIKEELEAWMDRISQAEVRMSDLNIRQNAEINELERLKNRPDEAQSQMKRLSETKSAAEEARKNAADKLAVAETELAEVEKQSRDADKKLGLEREERVRSEAVVEQVALYQSELAERIKEKLQCLPEEILDKAGLDINDASIEIDETEARIERLARERERIGPVNLRAEIEVEELEQKITDMETERDDLNGAIDRLRRAISSLNKEGRSRLLQAFDDVNSHFQKLFTRLFGGGSAHLKLIEAEDPLDAGIEIMASPPGKKLQTMSLLSGGEQALTALALIFSAFLTNPAPICVLDEVDAPLDDSNVDRFCSTLRELSNITNTRFLIITHHRLTMARMDRLFGVTMAEQGVSQLVSVNLEGAEKLRETA